MNQERIVESYEELVNMVADLECLRDVVRDLKTELDSLTEKVFSSEGGFGVDEEQVESMISDAIDSLTFSTYID